MKGLSYRSLDLIYDPVLAYNNSYQTTIKMALYETLYDEKCRSLLLWDEIDERDVLTQTLGLEMT